MGTYQMIIIVVNNGSHASPGLNHIRNRGIASRKVRSLSPLHRISAGLSFPKVSKYRYSPYVELKS